MGDLGQSKIKKVLVPQEFKHRPLQGYITIDDNQVLQQNITNANNMSLIHTLDTRFQGWSKRAKSDA
jgi:hypothetical protein